MSQEEQKKPEAESKVKRLNDQVRPVTENGQQSIATPSELDGQNSINVGNCTTQN